MSCGKRFYGTTIKPQSIFYSILLKAKLQPVKTGYKKAFPRKNQNRKTFEEKPFFHFIRSRAEYLLHVVNRDDSGKHG